ncbi:MAG TPA: insulinase family protein [Panacibacter sp.]|nr:insulinase family protein [Panacibacter sp.]HNP42813.1 insulinase family protein [Panacibacter sp.]
MLKRLNYTFVLVFVSLFTASAIAQNLSDKIPFDGNVKTGKLANGLTYYIRQNKKPENKVEMRLAVNAGAILEEDDQQGLAHFTEHMAFNGSKHFKKNELVDFLQKLGIEFGADLNAYTGFDETVYILPVPLSDTANLRRGLTVLQDWAGGLSFDNDEIDGERGVVLEESRLGKGADDRMFRKIYPLQYEGSKYANRLPIGKDSIIKNAPYDVVKRFYKDYYRPDLMAVIIVGDVDVNATEKLVKEYFGGLVNPAKEKPRTMSKVPARTVSKSVIATDKEATNYFVQVDYPAAPSKVETTLKDYRDYLVKNLFTSLLNQRFAELTRSANPPFLFAGAGFSGYARGYENFSAYAVAGKGGPDSALVSMMTEIERAKRFGFTENELERAKKQQIASIEQSYNNRDKTESSNYVEEYARVFLQQEPSPGIAKEFEYYKQMMPGITLKEVNDVAAPLKQNDKIFVSLQGPESSNYQLPDNAGLLALAQNAMKADVKPYAEKAVASTLMKTKPQPGSIVKEQKNEQLGTTEITFANGAKAILKPTDFKDDEIVMTAFHKGGTSKYPAEDKFSANYASTIAQTMGIGDFSPVDLQKYMAGKVAAVMPRVSGLSAGFSGNSSVKDAETMLQMLNLYFTAPRKDEALFNAWKEKQQSSMQFAMSDPQTVFIDSFYNVVYQKNPLAPVVIPTPDDFNKINLDRSIAIFKEQFADANDFNFIFVGNIDIEKMKPLLATYIGSLPSQGKPAAFADNGVRPVKGNVDLTVKKGTEPKALIIGFYSGEIAYTDELAFKAKALTEILNIKIIEDLREKMGAIYGGGIFGGLNKYPYSNYSLFLQLPCGPQNVDTLLKAAAAEIEKVKANGPEQVDLDKVKKTWIEQYKVQIKENSYWSGKLQGIYFQGDSAAEIFNYEEKVNALTTDDIKATANKLFDNKNVVKAVLLPENQ